MSLSQLLIYRRVLPTCIPFNLHEVKAKLNE